MRGNPKQRSKSKWHRLADQLIPKPKNQVIDVKGEDFTVDDIIEQIIEWHHLYYTELARFAPKLKSISERQTIENVWTFVYEEINYIKDGNLWELVKSPAQTFDDGFGDCKSMSLLAGALFHNLNIWFDYRVAGYYAVSDEYSHIYVMTEKIPIDPTLEYFGDQAPDDFYMDLNVLEL